MMDANGLMKVTHMMALGGGRGEAADTHFSMPSAQVQCTVGSAQGTCVTCKRFEGLF